MDLTTLLDDAAPRLADRTPELDAALAELVTTTRPVPAGRRRRRLALVAGTLGLAGAVGLGGVAAAGIGRDLVRGAFAWTDEDDISCTIQATLEPREPSDPHYSASQQAALASAEAWLAGFDLDAVDRDAAGERWLRHLERVSAGDPTRAELEQRFHGERLESHALVFEVSRQLDHHLTEQGYDPRSLDGSVGVACE